MEDSTSLDYLLDDLDRDCRVVLESESEREVWRRTGCDVYLNVYDMVSLFDNNGWLYWPCSATDRRTSMSNPSPNLIVGLLSDLCLTGP